MDIFLFFSFSFILMHVIVTFIYELTTFLITQYFYLTVITLFSDNNKKCLMKIANCKMNPHIETSSSDKLDTQKQILQVNQIHCNIMGTELRKLLLGQRYD